MKLSNAVILFDESGDLGWVFDKPYRYGGSSRYFTIAAAIGANNKHRKFVKVISKVKKTQNWTSKKEKKWANIGQKSKNIIATEIVSLLKQENEIEILVSCIEKEKIPLHIREGNHHLIYAWMASSLISPSSRVFRTISLCPDDLNQGFGNNIFEDLIRKTMWFDLRSTTQINRISRSSPLEPGLALCDFVAGAVQDHFENKQSDPFNIIRKHIFLHKPLF